MWLDDRNQLFTAHVGLPQTRIMALDSSSMIAPPLSGLSMRTLSGGARNFVSKERHTTIVLFVTTLSDPGSDPQHPSVAPFRIENRTRG